MAQAKFTCPYDITEITNLGYVECMDILEDNNVDTKDLEELEELQDLIIKLIRQSKNVVDGQSTPRVDGDDSQTTFTSSADLMNEIISRDREIKQKLNGIYGDLERFFEMTEYASDPSLQNELEIEFKNVQKMVKESSEELMCDECPIVVTGETSAGKSSLLNLILGSNILPSSLRSNTSTVCRLHNHDQKMIKVYDHTGEKLVHSVVIDNNIKDDDLKKTMQKYISCEDNLYRYVDVFWPIPFLGSQVILVDTPGIGENSKMTSRLLDYLPKAVAFIYVLNSENAGGVQQDRLLRILEEQTKRRENGQKQTFDNSCTLFVLNKWDELPDSERERVWTNTKEKLSCWPGFTESQMFRLSTIEAERRYRNGLGYTEDFQTLLRGIQTMVPASFQEKVRQHAWWQERLLKQILFHVTAHINNTRLSQEEKRIKKKIVEERLHRLECDTVQVRRTLEDEAKKRCAEISEKLHAHIHDQKTVKKLKDWNIHTEIPDRESDFDLIEREAKEIILVKLGKEIKSWCENERSISNIRNELATRFREEYRLLEEQCHDIDNLVQDVEESIEIVDVDIQETEPSHRIPLFAGREKLALVLTSPLWVPLMVLAFSMAIPAMGVIAVVDSFKEKQTCKNYIKNKKAFMDKWADEVLLRFSHEAIASKLEMTYLENFYKCLAQLCDSVIPRQIESDRQLIANIQQEERNSSVIRRQYHPLEKRCQYMTGKLLLVQMEYFYDDAIVYKNITKGECLGKGSFADVYKAEIVIGDERKLAAVKCMRHSLEASDSCYSQLTEVSTLLKFSHGWIVKLFGVSYKEDGPHKYLQIIMELCDFTLSSQIFPGNDGRPAPVTSCSQSLLESSLEFFKRISMDICKGLVYIHKKRFIHRDLKPSNILIQGIRAKIADVGLTKESDLITGTLTGTPCYIAPEVILMKLYGTEVDIYSLGIILWELWYGVKAYEHDGITGLQIFEHVKAGHRPNFTQRHVPPPALQKLIKQCWHEDVRCRPKAGNVFDIIKDQNLLNQVNVDMSERLCDVDAQPSVL